MSKKLYTSDEDRMMQDKSLTWSEPAIMTKDPAKNHIEYRGQHICSKCNSNDITYRINYDFGEEWDEDRDDNLIHCHTCGHEIDDNSSKEGISSTSDVYF